MKKREATLADPLEKDIQRSICDWLASQGYFFWRNNNVPIFGRSNDGKKRFRAMPKYTPRGLPDIIVLFRGKFIALEVKRTGLGLKPEQADIAGKIKSNGGDYITVHSAAEVIEHFIVSGYDIEKTVPVM